MKQQKVLIFSSSTRKDSLNKKLCFEAQKILEKDNQVTVVDLKDFVMPLYDGDFEQENPYPKACVALKKHFHENEIIIIASAEYNGSITGVLKNTIDWLSRDESKKANLSAFRNKMAILMSASPSGFGGLKSLLHLRLVLSHIKMLVLPEQFGLSKANQAFGENNTLKEPKDLERLKQVLMQDARVLG